MTISASNKPGINALHVVRDHTGPIVETAEAFAAGGNPEIAQSYLLHLRSLLRRPFQGLFEEQIRIPPLLGLPKIPRTFDMSLIFSPWMMDGPDSRDCPQARLQGTRLPAQHGGVIDGVRHHLLHILASLGKRDRLNIDRALERLVRRTTGARGRDPRYRRRKRAPDCR